MKSEDEKDFDQNLGEESPEEEQTGNKTVKKIVLTMRRRVDINEILRDRTSMDLPLNKIL